MSQGIPVENCTLSGGISLLHDTVQTDSSLHTHSSQLRVGGERKLVTEPSEKLWRADCELTIYVETLIKTLELTMHVEKVVLSKQ